MSELIRYTYVTYLQKAFQIFKYVISFIIVNDNSLVSFLLLVEELKFLIKLFFMLFDYFDIALLIISVIVKNLI